MADDAEFKDNTKRNLMLGLTLIMLLAVGLRGYVVYRAHHAPAAAAQDTTPDSHLSHDDLVFPRNLHAATLADLQQLDGKRVWVQSGGETTFYAGSAKGADLLKPIDFLRGAEPLDVVHFVSQAVPQDPYADAWLVMLFRRSGDPKLYATQVGTSQGKQDNIVADQKFYYDDPHTLYAWPAAMWKAVDEHQPLAGMNEFQTNLALGQITHTSNTDKGDRTVSYQGNGKPVDVTFVGNKATKITPQ